MPDEHAPAGLVAQPDQVALHPHWADGTAGVINSLAPEALAQIATATLNAIAVRARTGAEPAALDALIDATVDVICGRPD